MKNSFFERLTGTISLKGNEHDFDKEVELEIQDEGAPSFGGWDTNEPPVGELSVDVYQTEELIVIQTMVAGVDAGDLSVSITREMVTIKGKREAPKDASPEDYFYQELFWGSFSRTILLPNEVETDEVEATERNGLLTIKLPKIDKSRVKNVKIKSV